MHASCSFCYTRSMNDLVSFAPVTQAQAHAILGAMLAVASANGPLSDPDRAAIAGAGVHVLETGRVDLAALSPTPPNALANALPDEALRRYALELLSVMAFIDGSIDNAKVDSALAYANALGVHDDYVHDLGEAAQQHITAIAADMARENQSSIRGLDPAGDFASQFLPYDANPDPALAEKFRALGALDSATFGRAYYDHYALNSYAFPGENGALSEKFALPHDSTHLLSGYSTSFQGEILVSTFTAAMHRSEGMGGHILPVIFSWHLGIQLNPLAVARHGRLDPEKFWRAWERGRSSRTDVFGRDFDFWSIVETPLQELRDGFGIPQLDAAHAADGKPLPVRGWPS